MNLAPEAPVDRDRRHARNPLEPCREFVLRNLTKRDGVEVSFDRQVDDRLGAGVGLEDLYSFGVLRHSAADTVNAGSNFVQRLAHVGAPAEVQANLTAAFLRRRRYLFQTGDGADGL